MTRRSALAAEIAVQPRLTPVRAGDPALTTVLLLNAVRRGFARIAATVGAVAEPDWPGYLSGLVSAGTLPIETLLDPGAHVAVPLLASALPALDRAVISHEYVRGFGGELLTHETTYLAHLGSAGAPLHVRAALVARIRHEALLRDLETLISACPG